MNEEKDGQLSEDRKSSKELKVSQNYFLHFRILENFAELDINQFPLKKILNVNMKLWLSMWNFECQYKILIINIKFSMSIWKPRRIANIEEFDESLQTKYKTLILSENRSFGKNYMKITCSRCAELTRNLV